MNILILGATGRVGSYLTRLALDDNHKVTVLVRTPDKISYTHNNLKILEGNVLNKDDVARAMNGNDIVISALNTDGTTTLSDGMPIIIDAMKHAAIQRIITIGTAGILQSRTSPELLRYQSNESKRKTTRAAKEHEIVFRLLNESNLDWTIVCPTYLLDGTLVGNYRVERNFLPADGVQISVPDTAAFAYRLIEDQAYLKTRVGIAY